MLSVLLVTFPFFALVLAGFVAARRRMLPLEAIPGLNGFVLFFALPCMLFRFGASTPIAQLLDAGVFFTYLVCALIMVAFTIGVSLNARIRWNDASLALHISGGNLARFNCVDSEVDQISTATPLHCGVSEVGP